MINPVSRRSFLTAVALGTSAGSILSDANPTLSAQDKAVPEPLAIIDTHQHLWDLNRFKLPWHKEPDTKPLQRSFLMSDYLTATKDLNVVKTIYMEVDVIPEQQVDEGKYVTDLIERNDNPMRAAVVSGRPGTSGFETYIRKVAENKYIKGIRQVLHGDST